LPVNLLKVYSNSNKPSLRSVASRRQETADEFAKKFGAIHAYPDYQKLADDPEVDAIYIATPHSLHCENTILCLELEKRFFAKNLLL
jgi:predicted dehydrogenase